MKLKLIIVAGITSSGIFQAFAQTPTTGLDYGSVFVNNNFVIFANNESDGFSNSVLGTLGIGYFQNPIVGNASFEDYIEDFFFIDSFSFSSISEGSGAEGFRNETVLGLTADASAFTPYLFLFSGQSVDDLSGANVIGSLETDVIDGFALVTDSSWAFAAPSSPVASFTSFVRSTAPDTILDNGNGPIGLITTSPNGFGGTTTTISTVPEPSFAIFATGLLGAVILRRRRA